MVSIMWAVISMSAGLMCYLIIGFVAFAYPIEVRKKVGDYYLKMAARCFKQFTFLRRVLSGYDIKTLSVDDDQRELLTVTLNSSLIGSDREYKFSDPDNRIKRLYNKPVALNFELIPAAIDAELAEVGHWVRQKRIEEGLWHGDLQKDPENVKIDPYVPMSDKLRLVDPIDAFEIVPNAVDPENIETTKQLTKKRYEEYGSRIGLAETMGTLMGFAVGLGAVAMLKYLNQNLIDGDSGTNVEIPLGGFFNWGRFDLAFIDPTALQTAMEVVLHVA